jgi:hypothetical protein
MAKLANYFLHQIKTPIRALPGYGMDTIDDLMIYNAVTAQPLIFKTNATHTFILCNNQS